MCVGTINGLHTSHTTQTTLNDRDRNAVIKAMGMLRIMDYAESNKFCSVAVDETCYRYYLLTSAKGSVIPEQGPLADQILNKLKDQYRIVPDQVCYASVIKTYKNAALNPLFGESRERNVARAVELLEELSIAQNRGSERDIRPTTENFNDVLEALSASYRAVSSDIAETLVAVMETSIQEQKESTMSDILPNAYTYKWLLSVHTNSKNPDKVELAEQVLQRMKNNLKTVIQSEKYPEESVVGVYNAFIKVCASAQRKTEPHDPYRKNEVDSCSPDVLQRALRAAGELSSLYGLKPSSDTYALLLEVCEKHLETGSDRARVVEDIFQGCCEEGLVDEHVLQTFKKAATEEQYSFIVLSKSINVEGTRMIPEEWTRNVGLAKVITAEGRRAIPLSIDGRYTITKAMKEYSMRKLRSKVSQRLLQGGRLKLSKIEIGKPMRIRLHEEFLSSS